MFRKILSILFLTQVLCGVAVAQNDQTAKRPATPKFDNIAFLAWDVNFPTGDLSSFISKTSFAGGTFGYRKMLNSGNISIGGDITWNSFYEYAPRKTYQIPPNGAITTDLYKYVYTLPFGLNAHYYFNGGKLVAPYAGLGLGATYSQQQIYYNTYVSEDDNWGFYIRPELGAYIKFDEYSTWGILAGVRYNYSTNKQEDFKLNSITSVSAQLGIAWTW